MHSPCCPASIPSCSRPLSSLWMESLHHFHKPVSSSPLCKPALQFLHPPLSSVDFTSMDPCCLSPLNLTYLKLPVCKVYSVYSMHSHWRVSEGTQVCLPHYITHSINGNLVCFYLGLWMSLLCTLMCVHTINSKPCLVPSFWGATILSAEIPFQES